MRNTFATLTKESQQSTMTHNDVVLECLCLPEFLTLHSTRILKRNMAKFHFRQTPCRRHHYLLGSTEALADGATLPDAAGRHSAYSIGIYVNGLYLKGGD